MSGTMWIHTLFMASITIETFITLLHAGIASEARRTHTVAGGGVAVGIAITPAELPTVWPIAAARTCCTEQRVDSISDTNSRGTY
jgi:hypothetical protein